MLLTHLVTWGVLAFGQVPVQDADRKVEGLLVCSNDSRLLGRVRRDFQLGSSLTVLHSTFKGVRYAIFPWGKRSAILIDRESSVLESRRQRSEVLSVFLKSGSNPVLDFGSLKPEERVILLRHIRKFLPFATPGAAAKVGLRVGTRFNMTVDGKSIQFSLPAQTDRDSDLRSALANAPFTVDGNSLSESQRNDSLRDAEEASLRDQKVEVVCFGVATHYMPEGIQELGKHLQVITDALEEEAETLSRQVADRILSRDLNAESAFADLPERVQQQLANHFEASWEALGFASKDEATKFLAARPDVKISTVLSMGLGTRTGARAGFTAIEIASARGGSSQP